MIFLSLLVLAVAVVPLSLLENDSHCSDIATVSRDTCLHKDGCMWLELDSKNLCLPCSYKGIDIPCAPIGSVFAMKKVSQCEMNCSHQKLITKDSPCTDVEGSITVSQCTSKGLSALTKCMWTSYTDARGKSKSMCGPCNVMAVGTIPCAAPGMLGPEAGSTVSGCVSMCDSPTTPFGIPCDGGLGIPAVTDCMPTKPPPLPPLAPVPMDVLRITTTKNAPDYFAVPVMPPYGVEQYTESAAVGAQAAGWTPGNSLPPDSPVVIYGTAPFEGPTLPPTLKVMFGPPPPGIPGVPPPGYGMGTAPPPENVEASKKQTGFLQKRGDRYRWIPIG
eukprot:GEMP01055484.1.p1 GENE.GEMP01055484.1~~GEMP01055484.1.p1  ORF type:complete len:332 (+),score=81.85 GEMP01055484.1:218-1213(+)